MVVASSQGCRRVTGHVRSLPGPRTLFADIEHVLPECNVLNSQCCDTARNSLGELGHFNCTATNRSGVTAEATSARRAPNNAGMSDRAGANASCATCAIYCVAVLAQHTRRLRYGHSS